MPERQMSYSPCRSCIKYLKRILVAVGLISLSISSNLYAAQDNLTETPDADWASSLINFLFHGNSLPDALSFYGARLSPLVDSLRHALGMYNMSMLVLAGILVLYHVIAIILDTAHQGVVMGQRANQIWAPIRLAFAILLLVPVNSGLSSGQYLVLKIASSGSNLASRAWETMADAVSGQFSALVTPRGPDVAALVATATEMEFCRQIYQQLYAPTQNETVGRLIGVMGELNKIPESHIIPETWRYSNALNANEPMCGEYRFQGFRFHSASSDVYSDATNRLAEDLNVFSRSEADILQSQTRMIAARTATYFTSNDSPTVLDIQTDMKTLEKSIESEVAAHIETLSATNATIVQRYLTHPTGAGWLSAGFFIPELVRLQESYGELISHILPSLEGPLFSHPLLVQQTLSDRISTDPSLRNLDDDVLDTTARFYAQVSHTTAHMSSWLYGTQIANDVVVPVNSLDIHDHATLATDPESIMGIFANALDSAAISRGVWGVGPKDLGDPGNPFSVSGHESPYNIFTAMIEFGRRQVSLGSYLVGLTSGALSAPQLLVPAITVAILGLMFSGGGALLILAAPLLPFLRFMLAALTWLLELFEALAAIPIVALAHLSPSGDGLSGSTARQAYLLWIALAVRPLLTVFGLVLGFILFTLGMSLMEIALAPLAYLASPTSSSILTLANVGLVFVYDIAALAIVNITFKGIYQLPDHALRWISTFVVTDGVSLNAPASSSDKTGSLSPGTVLGQIAQYMQKATSSTTSTSDQKTSTTTMGSSSTLFPLYRHEEKNPPPPPLKNPGANSPPSYSQQNPKEDPPSSVTSSPLSTSQSDGKSSRIPSSGGTTPSPHSNAPFFQNKDKPNNEQ